MKKILPLTLASALICSALATTTVYAEDITSIGLNRMIELAEESNVSYQVLKKQEERERDDYVTAKAIAVSLEQNFDIDDSFTFSDKQKLELDPLSEGKEYKDKLYEVLSQEKEIDYKSKELFYTLSNLKEDLRSKKDYYDFMQSKRESKKTELEVGQITQLQYDEFEVTFQNAFVDYLKAANSLERKQREINIFLDQDPLIDIDIVESSMTTLDLEAFDLESLFETMLENSYQIAQLETEKDIKEKELELKQRFKGFGEVAIEMDLLEDQIMKLDGDIEDMKRSIKLDLYSKYNDAKIAEKNIEVSQLDYELAKRTYEIAELKYDNGLVSLIDLSESRKAFETAYYNINDAKLQAYLQVQNFANFVELNTARITAE
ncbi:TolC family protein [Fusibacter sp. JL216-2]|uniref:TolC family protein n=1 Tax=Fusibacter sp. JL216-2 TaxID=3071453 RepID=UPI003D326E71